MILDTEKKYVNMKTDEARRAKIKANLDRLNYAKGNGLLETAKKPLIQNEIYLIYQFRRNGTQGFAVR